MNIYTLEDGHLIHEFLGDKCKSFVYQYATEWRYLMQIVEEIEKLPGVSIHIQNELCGIKPGLLRPRFYIQNFGETKIEAVYKSVIEFIKWHKKNNK